MALKIALIIYLVLLSTCGEAQQTEREKLIGTWNHSVEEQTDSVLVFRPEAYKLPRVRGREKMEFKENGDYIYYQIAPSDGYLKLNGAFELHEKDNILSVTFIKQDKQYSKHYEILKLSQEILMLKLIK